MLKSSKVYLIFLKRARARRGIAASPRESTMLSLLLRYVTVSARIRADEQIEYKIRVRQQSLVKCRTFRLTSAESIYRVLKVFRKYEFARGTHSSGVSLYFPFRAVLLNALRVLEKVRCARSFEFQINPRQYFEPQK